MIHLRRASLNTNVCPVNAVRTASCLWMVQVSFLPPLSLHRTHHASGSVSRAPLSISPITVSRWPFPELHGHHQSRSWGSLSLAWGVPCLPALGHRASQKVCCSLLLPRRLPLLSAVCWASSSPRAPAVGRAGFPPSSLAAVPRSLSRHDFNAQLHADSPRGTSWFRAPGTRRRALEPCWFQ